MKNLIITLCTCAQLMAANAQTSTDTPWTLEKCISHALEHNITVRQQQNTVRQQQIQLDDNRGNHLPVVDASVGQNFSFGRGLTAQNTYENTNTSSTSFSIGASVPIFSGNKIVNSVKLAQLNLDASLADLDKAREDISMQVAKAYVQILYDMEVADVARRQIAIDSMQTARLQAMMRSGEADNNCRLSLLALSQLLELPTPEGFSIQRPDVASLSLSSSLPPLPDVVYAEALGLKPQIKAEQLRLSASEYSIRIARGDYMPTLSLNGGLGTNYYKTSGFDADAFGTQLKNNFSQYIGVNLSIPVFNHFATRNKIRMAKLDRDNQTLRLEDTRKTLYKEIQQVYYAAIAAHARLCSCSEALRSGEDAFELTKSKYENGKATITEFNEQKNNMLTAQSDMIQAKYEYLYQTSLLDFYRGRKLDLR